MFLAEKAADNVRSRIEEEIRLGDRSPEVAIRLLNIMSARCGSRPSIREEDEVKRDPGAFLKMYGL